MQRNPLASQPWLLNGASNGVGHKGKSRFHYFNVSTFDGDEDEGGEMIFRTGIVYKPSPAFDHEAQNKRAFLKTVLSDPDQQVKSPSALVRAQPGGINGTKTTVWNCKDEIDGIGQKVGTVTINEVKNGFATTLVHEQLQMPLPACFGGPLSGHRRQAWGVSDPSETVQINVVNHNNGKRYRLTTKMDTVDQLKQRIAAEVGIPAKSQELAYGGKTLTSGRPLSYYRVRENGTVNIMSNMVSG